ncbi:MAG: response regulator [Thermodesulfobacteriota bacterium]
MKSKTTSIYGRILSLSIGSVILVVMVITGLYLLIIRQVLESHINSRVGHHLARLAQIIAVPLINQDYVQMVNIIDEETKGGDIRFVWLTDENGRVIVSNDERQLMAPIASAHRLREGFSQRRLDNGWFLCAVPDFGIMNSILLRVIPWTLMVLVFIIAATIFFFIRLIKNITLPLSSAIQASSAMAGGNFTMDLADSGVTEIDTLNRSLMDTGRKLDELTSRLKNEKEELEKSREEIRSLSEFRESIIDNATVWLNVLDKDARVIVWNKAAEEISGYDREEVLGTTDIWQLLYPEEEYRERIFSTASDIIRRGEVAEDLTTVIRTKSGARKYISWYSKNLKSADGVTVGSIAMGIDITEKKRAEDSLRQAQKMETVGALAGGIAHDFNNILMGILGAVSLMELEMDRHAVPSKESVNKYLTTMRNAAERASDIVKHLLTLSRRQELELAVVDLNMAVRHIAKICQSSFDKSITIRVAIGDEPATVMADLTQVEQLLLNLCVNASHAMTIMRPEDEKWGGALSITSTRVRELPSSLDLDLTAGDYWKLSVEDTGVGIPKDLIQNIFDPFFTTKEKGVGTGLGLSMAYSIVRAHNGFITVYSEPGQGSVFNIFLPAVHEEVAQNTEIRSYEIAGGSGLILVVDDEHANREILKMMLEGCGYEVITAADGEEGVRLYAEHMDKIRAVILDIVMPRMSGEEACARILDMNSQARVIVSSGFRDDSRVNKALARGAKLFVPKPYSLQSLSSAIRSILG